MIKFKWWFPFSPFFAVFLSDPYVRADRDWRYITMFGALLLTGILLLIVQPWKLDDGSDEKPRLRVDR